MEEVKRQVYTVEEVAVLLGISCSYAYKLAKKQIFPVLQLGQRIVVPKVKFDKWLEEGQETE